jgi:surface protein
MKHLVYKIGITIMAMTLVWSCSKDDGPAPNTAPVMVDQSFDAAETIADTATIGTVKADDADGDDLTFSITSDASSLFEISDSGALGLRPGKSLNFDTAESHTITVAVTDGEEEATATITITVGDGNTAAPVFGQASYQFEESEGIESTIIIGIVDATDADATDDLTFAIAENDNGLFEINNAGEISLATEMELDYETATEHIITVSVTDGTETVNVEVTITVLNIPEADPDDPTSFVTTWQTDADGETIYIGLNPDYNYDFTINWGDGTIEEINLDNPTHISHVYETAEQHTVAIIGDFPAIQISGFEGDLYNIIDPQPKDGFGLIGIKQWGDIQWQTMDQAFSYASTLEFYNATDAPDLTNVTSLSRMFAQASLFDGDLDNWDVTTVTEMFAMFSLATSFNGNIESWSTENVTNMQAMFFEATSFNGDISGWNTGSVKRMAYMFQDASTFDQFLGDWDISSIDPVNASGLEGMLDNSGMSPNNFADTLIGWEAADNAPSDIVLGAVDVQLCFKPEATTAFQSLTDPNTYNWTIQYAGGGACE